MYLELQKTESLQTMSIRQVPIYIDNRVEIFFELVVQKFYFSCKYIYETVLDQIRTRWISLIVWQITPLSIYSQIFSDTSYHTFIFNDNAYLMNRNADVNAKWNHDKLQVISRLQYPSKQWNMTFNYVTRNCGVQ